ncbi:MAG: hypothetical protein ACFFB5_22300 [Promethearchaeota archaeon]
MKDIAALYEFMKKNNILAGIMIFDIIAFFSFLLNPISLVAIGDLDFIFGGVVGILFALHSRKAEQGHLTLCLVVGIGGALLSALSISVLAYWIYYVSEGKENLNALFLTIIFFSMIAGIIGTLIGGIFGFITRLTSPESSKDSEEVFRAFKIDKS